MERSYGVIPCSFVNEEWTVFLIKDHHGNCGFPKGHADGLEGPLEAAKRELFEETALTVEEWLSETPFILKYSYGKNRREKEVYLYPALVSGIAERQAKEIAVILSVPLDQGEVLVSFKETKNIFPELRKILKGTRRA